MRILLLNDTTNNAHLGSCAVCNALRLALAQRDGAEIRALFNRGLHCLPSGDLDDPSLAVLDWHLEWCDLVVVNGEGTIHHDRAPELLAAVRRCIEAGQPFAVVNALFESYPAFVPLLSRADCLSLRDGASLDHAWQAGLEAVACADAALFAAWSPEPGPATPGAGCLVTDWHPAAPEVAAAVSLEHLGRGAAFFPFRRSDAVRIWPQTVVGLSAAGQVVTGRYHGALLALKAARPLTLLPSNSLKMRQLLRDLGLDPGVAEESWPVEIAAAEARQAAARLAEMAADPALHPLFALGLRGRIHPVARSGKARPDPWVPDAEAPAADRARRLADWLAVMAPPQRKGPRQRIAAVCRSLDSAILAAAVDLLVQEGHCHAAVHLLGLAGSPEESLPAALALQRAAPGDPVVAGALVRALLATGNLAPALALAEGAVLPDRDLAALCVAARRQKRHELARVLVERLWSGDDGSEALRSRAVAASWVRDRDAACRLARQALAARPPLSGWPRHHMAIVLAANGAFAEGCRLMALSGLAKDEAYRAARNATADRGPEALVYVDPDAGIGSAVLQLLPLLRSDCEGVAGVICDPRLHPALRRALPGFVRLLADPAEAGAAGWPGRVVAAYERLAALDPVPGPPVLTAEPDLQARIARRYDARFGVRRRIGLAWRTPNLRTGRFRNLSTAALRDFLQAHPDTVFLSLQPVLSDALADARVIGCDNLVVDDEIDPITDLEAQFAQIAALSGVVSIDCSAAHFAGALGIPAEIVNPAEPTWQWPMDRSLLDGVRLRDGLGTVDMTRFGGS